MEQTLVEGVYRHKLVEGFYKDCLDEGKSDCRALSAWASMLVLDVHRKCKLGINSFPESECKKAEKIIEKYMLYD